VRDEDLDVWGYGIVWPVSGDESMKDRYSPFIPPVANAHVEYQLLKNESIIS
jgi:hypothetical protein